MILLVDDDPSVTESLSLLLKQRGLASCTAANPEEALARLADSPVDLVLQDMNFSRDTSGREGLELLEEIARLRPELPVILITAWGSIGLAVEGMKRGARDFVTKPWNNDHLLQAIETALQLAGDPPAEEAHVAREELDRRYELGKLIGQDPRFLSVIALAGRVSGTNASVLIGGESGTGKELVAEAIHRNSPRKDGPFVKVNLGGVSSTLFESEMFGHVRGAFTDARSDRRGRFDVADGGTIFLDEIGELDAGSQVKLLRVLQDRTFEVLGSSSTKSVDVRVVSATNRDLAAEVAAGNFREDLLYRLNLISIRLPALRERPSDIPLLANHFCREFGEHYGRGPLQLDADAVAWLCAEPWPGNVRQLRQTIERAVLVLEGDRLRAADLKLLSELEARPEEPSLPAAGEMTLDQMEKAMIEKCLGHYGSNVSRVAEALGLSRAALYRRFQKYGIDPER
ncbi:chemotaxis protein CheY [Acidobacteria bacterium Mor1]|nr:chemotaxis protein CheY [Acidobacteria bacterium Mor1]